MLLCKASQALTIGDDVYPRPRHEYTLQDMKIRNLPNQRLESLAMVRKISSLAYELKLSPTLQIRPVTSIEQLKAAKEAESYKHRIRHYFDLISETHALVKKSWKVNRIQKERKKEEKTFSHI